MPRGADALHGASGAVAHARRADERPQFHDRLVVRPRGVAARGKDRLGNAPELREVTRALGIAARRKDAGQDARHVRVDQLGPRLERE